MAGNMLHAMAPAPSAAPVAAPQMHALMDKPALVRTAAGDTDAALSADDRKMLGNQKQQKHVTEWLAKRYRVANDATNMLVSTAYLTAREMKIDPLLILAVMAIESGFNPFAESPMGAQGLMQVMSKVHRDKFEQMGGAQAALNPVANIRVGAQILKEYVSRGGSVEAGLKTYVGAGAFETDSGYGSRVMAEYRRLKMVASGRKVPTVNTPSAPATIVADKSSPATPVAAKVEEVVAAPAADPIAGL
jgi:soluble lytic murein transglycosylase-like protein